MRTRAIARAAPISQKIASPKILIHATKFGRQKFSPLAPYAFLRKNPNYGPNADTQPLQDTKNLKKFPKKFF